MPSQLIDNSAISFICGRNFVYAGEKYEVGDDFPQEKANNIETMVRSRHLIPVVEDLADKPRHWYREVQQRSIALEKLGRARPTGPDFPVADYKVHTPWEETQDNAAEIKRKQQIAINENRAKSLDDEERTQKTQEVKFVDGKEESEPNELVGPGVAEDADVKVMKEEEPEPAQSDLYDPSSHTLVEVQEYLTDPTITDAERDRVVEAERQGKARKGIVG